MGSPLAPAVANIFMDFYKSEWFYEQDCSKWLKKDNKPHIFKHLHSTASCFDSYDSLSSEIIDKANSKFGLKVKEALHINLLKLIDLILN